jgi:hypothetical protein
MLHGVRPPHEFRHGCSVQNSMPEYRSRKLVYFRARNTIFAHKCKSILICRYPGMKRHNWVAGIARINTLTARNRYKKQENYRNQGFRQDSQD